MSTLVNRTNRNLPNSSISIPDGQSNSSWTSLILFGKNASNYGSALNNDLVSLLENWANNSPPPSASTGQLWFDTVARELKIYDPTQGGWKLINANAIQGLASALVQNRIHVAKNGDDANSGLTWNVPKRTIKSACAAAANQIAAGNFTPGHVAILVASGDYSEVTPITVPEGVAIIGDNLRSVTVRPFTATNDVFLLNSKCYVYGLTVRGHQLQPSALDITPLGYADNSGLGLPANTPQTGWAFGFAPGANIQISPYVQNCSSISGDPATGSGSATPVTVPDGKVFIGGGGVLVDSNVISTRSRIHSIVVDAFTQINLGGIGVKVVNRGYMQLVSFFVNFCQFGMMCVDGGHITALNSNCSFGNYALWSEGSRNLNSETLPGDGTTRVFTLKNTVKPAQLRDLQVTVAGVSQVLNVDYALTLGNTLTFANPPPAGKDIAVSVVFGSLIEASGYTMSYAGAGITYGNDQVPNDLSVDQGGTGSGDPNKYTIARQGGRIYHTTTDENGDFYVGTVTPGALDPLTGVQGSAKPTFRINQRQGIIDGRAFYQSIFGFMTPFVLALTRKK
jgi:hypothetical protein